MSVISALVLIISAHQSVEKQDKDVSDSPPPVQHDDSAWPYLTPRNNFEQWIGPDDYPPKALRQELEGDVEFRLIVNTKGHVSACIVTVSSGHGILDMTTCKLLSQRAQFSPALDNSGKPIISSYTSQIRWVLPE